MAKQIRDFARNSFLQWKTREAPTWYSGKVCEMTRSDARFSLAGAQHDPTQEITQDLLMNVNALEH